MQRDLHLCAQPITINIKKASVGSEGTISRRVSIASGTRSLSKSEGDCPCNPDTDKKKQENKANVRASNLIIKFPHQGFNLNLVRVDP